MTSPSESRRRARFAARRLGNGEVILGFNQRRSRRIVDLAACDVLLPAITKRLPDIRDMLAALLAPGSACDVQVTATGSGLDLWLICNDDPSAEVRLRLARMADDIDLARLSIGHDAEPVAVRRPVMVDLSGTRVELPPGAFLQATADGETSLCRVVRDVIEESRSKSAADLFCGIGTFTFAISPFVEVFAVENDASSLDAIRNAAGSAQNLHKITCERRDLERRPLSEQELQRFDAVVFDPPRAGARAQAAALSRSTVPLIVAVSCNPATFSRDARILLDGGYRLDIVWPVDQFLWSPHLELVAIFRR